MYQVSPEHLRLLERFMRRCSRASAITDLCLMSAARQAGEGQELQAVETKIIDLGGGGGGGGYNFC